MAVNGIDVAVGTAHVLELVTVAVAVAAGRDGERGHLAHHEPVVVVVLLKEAAALWLSESESGKVLAEPGHNLLLLRRYQFDVGRRPSVATLRRSAQALCLQRRRRLLSLQVSIVSCCGGSCFARRRVFALHSGQPIFEDEKSTLGVVDVGGWGRWFRMLSDVVVMVWLLRKCSSLGIRRLCRRRCQFSAPRRVLQNSNARAYCQGEWEKKRIGNMIYTLYYNNTLSLCYHKIIVMSIPSLPLPDR